MNVAEDVDPFGHIPFVPPSDSVLNKQEFARDNIAEGPPAWMDEASRALDRDVSDPVRIKATPFSWRPESSIPPRKWLYGKHLLRKFLSLDVAAGGVGKSSVKIGEALSMASGKPFYGKQMPEGALTVWFYNLEDPAEETERRVHATAKWFKITVEDVGDRLYSDSGRDTPLVIATETDGGTRINVPLVDALIAEILERKIDVMIVDPFVSSHSVSENDNRAIDMIAKQWGQIADRCNCSINLVHHVRKQNGQEATADSARGASALIGAARSVMVYNRMTKDEAENAGLKSAQANFHFRIQNDKANLAPAEAADWFRMNNVTLENGDDVGVACPWTWPDTFAGIGPSHAKSVQRAVAEGSWRKDVRSGEKWVGTIVASILAMDPDSDRKRIQNILKQWVKNDVLREVERDDENRRSRIHVEVGTWITE